MKTVTCSIITAAALIALSGVAFTETGTYGPGSTTGGSTISGGQEGSTNTAPGGVLDQSDINRGGATGGTTDTMKNGTTDSTYEKDRTPSGSPGGTMGRYSTSDRGRMHQKW